MGKGIFKFIFYLFGFLWVYFGFKILNLKVIGLFGFIWKFW